MKEFTLRAVLLGLVMCVVLGAANAYLGLRAGQTIAATYPAAVIGMAVLRVFKGSILEENIARTAGPSANRWRPARSSRFPAFVMVERVARLRFARTAYWKSTALMLVGSVLGVLFVSLIRRVMVEDPELPFPESVAASEIHKAGQAGAKAAKYLFYNIGVRRGRVPGAARSASSRPTRTSSSTSASWARSTLRLGPLGSHAGR